MSFSNISALGIGFSVFQLDQQLDVVLGLKQISDAVLLAPAGNVLDHVAFKVPQCIGIDVLDWLNRQILVVAATFLFV